MNAICVEKKQTLSPFICVFVCRARTAANIPSKRQQGSKTPAHRTRLNQKMWTEKLYDGMAISHPPFRPFSHQISILKNSNPPSYVMLCIYPVREKEWKSETKQNQMVNFKMATMTREISRPSFVWRPFTCAPVSSPGPDGYPRVLDYSTFEFTTLPYSKNFTTRSSSRVVTISSFCPIIQIFGMGRHHSFLDNGRHVSNDVVAWSIRFRLHYSHRYIG